MRRFYTAIVERARDGFGVFFPDLPGCVSFGKSVEEAAANAYAAAQAHVALSREYGDAIAQARAPGEIPRQRGVKEKARLLIPVETAEAPVRVNISLLGAAPQRDPEKCAAVFRKIARHRRIVSTIRSDPIESDRAQAALDRTAKELSLSRSGAIAWLALERGRPGVRRKK